MPLAGSQLRRYHRRIGIIGCTDVAASVLRDCRACPIAHFLTLQVSNPTDCDDCGSGWGQFYRFCGLPPKRGGWALLSPCWNCGQRVTRRIPEGPLRDVHFSLAGQCDQLCHRTLTFTAPFKPPLARVQYASGCRSRNHSNSVQVSCRPPARCPTRSTLCR